MKRQESPVAPIDANVVIAQWLDSQRFTPPKSANAEGITLMTSDDIIRALSDMCDLDINAVASAMIDAGYKMVFTSHGKHGWALERR